jgi:tetratricopeptide (TPR) repeat protein
MSDITSVDTSIWDGRLGKYRKRLPVIGIVALVLVAAVISFVWYMHGNDETVQTAAALKADKRQYENSVDQSDKNRGTGDYAAAVTDLQDYADGAVDPKNKAYAYVRIGTIYETKKDPAKALENYRKAEGILGTADIAVGGGIARTSEALGDKPTAIKYYKLEITLYEKAGRDYFTADILRLKQQVTELEKSS